MRPRPAIPQGYRYHQQTAFQFWVFRGFSKRNSDRTQTAKPMPFLRRNHSMDQAMKAGIGATACSVPILAIVLLAMRMVPLNIG